jgi:hypothetical protein
MSCLLEDNWLFGGRIRLVRDRCVIDSVSVTVSARIHIKLGGSELFTLKTGLEGLNYAN